MGGDDDIAFANAAASADTCFLAEAALQRPVDRAFDAQLLQPYRAVAVPLYPAIQLQLIDHERSLHWYESRDGSTRSNGPQLAAARTRASGKHKAAPKN